MWLLGPRGGGFGGAQGFVCEFSLFFGRGGSKHQNLGPPTNQAYLSTDPPWRLARPEKIRVLRFTCIFHIFKLIARYSNYDFWIPGEILGLGGKSWKNIEKYFLKIKNQKKLKSQKFQKKNWNPKISEISKFQNFRFFIFSNIFKKNLIFQKKIQKKTKIKKNLTQKVAFRNEKKENWCF